MVKHYAFDNDPSCDLCAVVVDANGNYVKREDYDALAADNAALRERVAYVTQTLAPLVDDDNRPVEALARYAVARLAEVIAERDSIRTMLLNERTEWMDEAIRRQASVNQNLAALVTDAQEELRKCQQDAIQLQARLAEAERLLRGDLLVLLDAGSGPEWDEFLASRKAFLRATDSADVAPDQWQFPTHKEQV